MTMAQVLTLISAVKNVVNSKPINENLSLTPNHFLKNNWLLLKKDQNLENIQNELSTSLTQIIIAAGSAQINLIDILKRSWLITPRHHQLSAPRVEKFAVGDIVLYLVDKESKLARITKVHGNYSTIMITDKNVKLKYKNIHHRFLLLLLRCQDFNTAQSKQNEENFEEITDKVKQTEEISPELTDKAIEAKQSDNEASAFTAQHQQGPAYNTEQIGQLIISFQRTNTKDSVGVRSDLVRYK